jgi:hypothetical protein
MTPPRKDNCDICGKAFDTAKLGVVATCCGSLHCPDCVAEAEKRGDRSGANPWCWRRCKKCTVTSISTEMFIANDADYEIDAEIIAPDVVLALGKYPVKMTLFISPEVLPRLVRALTDALAKTQGPTAANS